MENISSSVQYKLDENNKLLMQWESILDCKEWSTRENLNKCTICRKKLHDNLAVLAKLMEVQMKRHKEKKHAANQSAIAASQQSSLKVPTQTTVTLPGVQTEQSKPHDDQNNSKVETSETSAPSYSQSVETTSVLGKRSSQDS
mmetsp:Transcript_24943/g.36790  ORF Transcript_24943/g.36790 Transcript_24943/m.36790 type:complete len:143 (+) Transcript_24943:72-500(+)